MKLAIISDIHSNLEALNACCTHAKQQGADGFVCLGDYVGYGADPAATLDLIMSLPGLIAVRGNHDDGVLDKMNMTVSPSVKQASAWTRARLKPHHLDFLDGLPYIRHAYDATFTHASAYQPEKWAYLYMPEEVRACMDASRYRLTFIGHVHVPNVFYETPRREIRSLKPQERTLIPLSHQRRYVINAGSIGQPRDRNNAACYVIYDVDAFTIRFHRVIYNYDMAGEKIRQAKLDPFFADRLAAGR